MANSLSAKKRIRQNAKRRMINRSRVSAVKTQMKKFLTVAHQSTNVEEVEKEYKEAQQKIDRLAAKGNIHKNTAARRKSRLVKQLNALKNKAG